MVSSSFIATNLLIFSAMIHQQTSSQVLHDGDKFNRMRLQSDLMSTNQQSPMSFNQRPTQFIASSQSNNQATAHSRGALVLPANNEIQASNFHLTIDPDSVRNYPSKPQHASIISTDNVFRDSSANLAALGGSNNQPATRNNHRLTSNDTLLMDQSSSNNSLLRGISAGDLELALRQANSDENVFPPPAAMIPPTADYSYDQWSLNTRPSTLTSSSSEQQDEKVKTLKQQQQEHQQAASTTDQSNSIVPVSLGPAESSSGEHHQSLNDNQMRQQQEPMQQTKSVSGGTAQQSSNQPIELSNQVFYEGPATATPVAGDYYFSSAERAPNNEKASSNIWW